MEVRDAVEDDAELLADIADLPPDVVRNLVHDRTVRVATTDGETIEGFVSFDAQGSVVHITQFGGTAEACQRLLDEPLRFARKEGMTVEVLVAAADDDRRSTVESAGFIKQGAGPMFAGDRTVRYRLAGD